MAAVGGGSGSADRLVAGGWHAGGKVRKSILVLASLVKAMAIAGIALAANQEMVVFWLVLAGITIGFTSARISRCRRSCRTRRSRALGRNAELRRQLLRHFGAGDHGRARRCDRQLLVSPSWSRAPPPWLRPGSGARSCRGWSRCAGKRRNRRHFSRHVLPAIRASRPGGRRFRSCAGGAVRGFVERSAASVRRSRSNA